MAEQECELLRRRRDHLILRVDRADLSKNVLRGFSSFDLFLEQHPEFRERVTFIAQLMPSRTDVPEYAEYLERIEALVAVVNHRHGTPDWMPIQLKLRDDLEEAVAAYKHYDVLLVNAMFDGMNLVAKEGPMVNERDGVSILSENTGAHEELGEHALSVNPFDIQAAGRLDPRRADDGARRARPPAARAEGHRHGARPRRLDRRAARRHPREGGADGSRVVGGRRSGQAELLGRRVGPGSRLRGNLAVGRPRRQRRQFALRRRPAGRGRRSPLDHGSPLGPSSRSPRGAPSCAALAPARRRAPRLWLGRPRWPRRGGRCGGHRDRGGRRQPRRASAQARPRHDQERERNERNEAGHVVPADPAPHAVGAHRAC